MQPGKSHLHDLLRQRAESQRTPRRLIPEKFTDIELGIKDAYDALPIQADKELIVSTIHNNPVTIIVAETGAGKSTQVPQYLLEAGYTVRMTQPRRLATRMVTERIADELEESFGDESARQLVGYRTAETNTTVEGVTRITLMTDGIEQVIQLGGEPRPEFEVTISDEVHEWNKNNEIIIGWQKKLLAEKSDIHLVVMSATMDAEKLAAFFEKGTGIRPPIIEVEGRTYNVDKTEAPESTIFDETLKYAKAGNNVLTFLPGVREIDDTKRELENVLEKDGIYDIIVLPLHGKLTEGEQNMVDIDYPGRTKIILSTNVAQTSLTIKDIDVVVDSGLERRVEINLEGVQSLRENNISQADCNQRAGRAGRTHEGLYVLTKLDKYTDFKPFINRDEYQTPEILRSDVDRNTLAVAATGLNFSKLELFHPLDQKSLRQSSHRLQLLGALDDDGCMTERGRRMNKFPVHPTSARMMVESDHYSDETRAYVAAVVSAVEVGGLPLYLQNSSRAWRKLSDEKQSDHLAQLDVFIAIQEMSVREIKQLGLDSRNVERARELYEKMRKRANISTRELSPPSAQQREEIVVCVAAGLIDFVYESAGNGKFVRAIGHHATEREISNRSTLVGSPTHLVGIPYGYQDKRKGEQSIIENVSAIKLGLLGKVAANLCVMVDSGPVKWRGEKPVYEQKEMFRGMLPTGRWQEHSAEPSTQLRKEIIAYVVEHPGNSQKALREVKKELERLQRFAKNDIPQLTQNDLERYILRATPKNITDPSLVDEYLRQIIAKEGLALDNFVPAEERERIYADAPAVIEKDGIELRLRYSNGKVRSYVSELKGVDALQEEAYLPDGRHIQLMYEKKAYTLQQLKEKQLKRR